MGVTMIGRESVGRNLGRASRLIGPVVATLLLFGAAITGDRLIVKASSARVAVERALRLQTQASDARVLVSVLESDRRGYELTRMPEHLAALRSDHERAHASLGRLRDAAEGSRGVVPHVDSAEAAVGSWSDEVMRTAGFAQSPAANLVRDRRLLGSARDHLDAIVTLTTAAERAAQSTAERARNSAEVLWLAVSSLTLVLIIGLLELARRRQDRARGVACEIGLLLEALPLSVLSLQLDGAIRHASGSARRMFGVADRELVGRRLAEFVVSADRPLIDSAVADATAGRGSEREALARAEFRVPRVLKLRFAPIVEDRRVVGTSVVVRDATGERALMTRTLHAERLSSIGSAAAGVAKELAQMLASIERWAVSLPGTRLSASDAAAVTAVAAESRRAARLVESLKTFSLNRAHLHEPTDLAPMIRQAVVLRQFDPGAADVEFDVQLPQHLPPVLGDAQELEQVLLALLVNAEYAVRNERVRQVSVRAEATRSTVQIMVTDTGAGIPEDRLEVVFEPFYTTKPAGEGTGLGLALARGVVAEHGGTLRAEHASSGGARLIVCLPQYRASNSDDIAAATEAEALEVS